MQHSGFGANLHSDGWVEEKVHIPGVVISRDEAVGTSPAMFTIGVFGQQPAVLQKTADRFSLFPMEGVLDSARSAETNGVRPENVSAYYMFA